MAMPVVTVASGGLAVVEVAAGLPVSEAPPGRGTAVTKVIGKPGLPVTFVTIGGGATAAFATLDGVPTNVALSNGNLTATHVGSANFTDGVRSTSYKSTGKFYFEAAPNMERGNDSIGILESTGSYQDLSFQQMLGAAVYASGPIWTNAANTGKNIGVYSSTTGHIVSVAVDIGARLVWYRLDVGNWNNTAGADPATGVGGLAMSATPSSFSPAVNFDGAVGASITLNFGASAFVRAVPAGFTAGWPA